MEAIDLRKLETAIIYVERIADGYNPVDNKPAEEESVLNSPDVVRCMFFIKDVLEAVRRNDGLIGKAKGKAPKEQFPYDVLETFCYREDLSITHLMAQIHLPLEGKNIKKISPQTVTRWLKTAGYLTEEFSREVGKISTVPTEKGKELGIYTEVRNYSNNTYLAVIYNRSAQEFIVKNLEAIVDGEAVV